YLFRSPCLPYSATPLNGYKQRVLKKCNHNLFQKLQSLIATSAERVP
ncbi:hypothetical protein WANA34_0427, partial [Wolbachia endosymbiont of Drosophila ananassae]